MLGAVMIPVFLLLDRARGRRRQLVHPQPPAPEPRRRRRRSRPASSTRRTGSVHPDRRMPACGRPRRARSPTRRASTPATPRRPTTRRRTLPRAPEHGDREPVEPGRGDQLDDRNYTDDTDNTDGGVGVVADPCYSHAPAADDISPAGGQWTDVRVKERNLPSLFGGIGLPLVRTGARARVEIRPALSGHRFLPLAVPNNVIEKVQVRYYNECTGAEIASARTEPRAAPCGRPVGLRRAGRRDALGEGGRDGGGRQEPRCQPHAPSIRPGRAATTFRSGRRSGSRAAPRSTSTRRARNSSRHGTPTASTGCRRSASGTTATRTAAAADERPRDGRLRRAGRRRTSAGSPSAANNCTFTVTAEVLWGNRDDRHLDVIGELPRHRKRRAAQSAVGQPERCLVIEPAGRHVRPGGEHRHDRPRLGRQRHHAQLRRARARTAATTPASTTPPSRPTRRSSAPRGTPAPSCSSNNSVDPGHGRAARVPVRQPPLGRMARRLQRLDTCLIFPTVGTESVLTTGVLTTLRLDDPQANQTLQCDPDYAQGQEFSAFRYGCKPWYSANQFGNGTWWNTTTKQCPDGGQWFSYDTMPAPFGKNSGRRTPGNACSRRPACRPGQVGDDIAVATENCDEHQQQLVPAVRLQLRRQLRRQAGRLSDRRRGYTISGGDSAYPARRQPVHRPVPGRQGADRRR